MGGFKNSQIPFAWNALDFSEYPLFLDRFAVYKPSCRVPFPLRTGCGRESLVQVRAIGERDRDYIDPIVRIDIRHGGPCTSVPPMAGNELFAETGI